MISSAPEVQDEHGGPVWSPGGVQHIILYFMKFDINGSVQVTIRVAGEIQGQSEFFFFFSHWTQPLSASFQQ